MICITAGLMAAVILFTLYGEMYIINKRTIDLEVL